MQRHPILIASLAYAAIALAVTGPALIGRASLGPDRILDWDPLYRTGAPPPFPRFGDFTPSVLDYPRDLAFARGLRAGRLDAWNPLSGAGAPLWAEQGGPFFPLKAVFYLAPSRQTYDLFLALRLVAAGLGSFLLARRRGLAGAAAFAAGATFELSGALLAMLPFGAASAPFLLPWLLLGALAMAENESARTAVAVAIALGITASSGHPTLVFLMFAAFGAAMGGASLRLWRDPRRLLRTAVSATAAVALGLALAAPSLLPLLELSHAGATYKERPIGRRMNEMSLASSRRSVSEALLASAALDTLPADRENPAALASSVGTLALFAAIAGALAGGLDMITLPVAILGAILALGPPGSALIRDLPAFHLVLPIYAWSLIALALAQLAGNGVRALSGPRAAVLGAASVGLLLIVSLALRIGASGAVLPAIHPVIGAAWMAAACVFLRRTRFLAVGIASAIGLEQLVTAASFALHPASTVLASPPSPAVEFLHERTADGGARMIAIPYLVGHPISPMLFGLADFRGFSALAVRRYSDFARLLSPGADLTVQEIWSAKSPLLDLAAVRYVVLPAPASPESMGPEALLLWVRHRPAADDPALPVAYADDRVVIHENRNALPRLRIAHRALPISDQAAAREWAAQTSRSNRSDVAPHIANTVALEADEHGEAAPSVSGEGSARENARLIETDDPDRIRIAARLDSPGLVVLADTYYPGWTAWVDGAPAPIFPADLMFRAVHVGAGEHAIEMRYEPRSLRLGALLAAIAAVICALGLFTGRGRAGRPESNADRADPIGGGISAAPLPAAGLGAPRPGSPPTPCS